VQLNTLFSDNFCVSVPGSWITIVGPDILIKTEKCRRGGRRLHLQPRPSHPRRRSTPTFSPAFLHISPAVCFTRVTVSIWCVKFRFTVSFTSELLMVTISHCSCNWYSVAYLQLLSAPISSGERERERETEAVICGLVQQRFATFRSFKRGVSCEGGFVVDSDLFMAQCSDTISGSSRTVAMNIGLLAYVAAPCSHADPSWPASSHLYVCVQIAFLEYIDCFVCMYVRTYVMYVCVCVRARACVRTYVCVYVCMYVCMCVCVFARARERVHAYVCTYACMKVFMHVCNACIHVMYEYICAWSRSQWPRGLRRMSAAAWLKGSWVRIPLRPWMFVSCVYMLCCPVR
jgi:hypothetical protein